jgi:hypothetical protein
MKTQGLRRYLRDFCEIISHSIKITYRLGGFEGEKKGELKNAT